MYITTPYGRVVALDPTSGTEVWVHQLKSGNPSMRGVEYWPGDERTPPQIVFGTSDGWLLSLNARTGEPNPSFGDGGSVNLNTPEILGGLPGNNGLSSPPIVYRHLIITGGRTQENPPRGPAGDVRAWDIHTGRLVWTFKAIPGPGEKFHDTWEGDSWKNRSGVNVWGFFTVDVERGIVYMPFGAPSVDQYGGDRPGNNLFSSSIVAADAATGKYLWHFQLVHHDIWDYDVASAPALFDVKKDGKTIPAVAVINKVGLLFLFNRVTGEPIYGVEERPVPQSEVPLERTAKTQPFPLKPAPLSRLAMKPEDVATVTPGLEAACRKLMEGVQLGGPFLPNGYKRLRLQFPGNHGGVNWGGVSFNPQLGYVFVNTNEFGQLSGLTERAPNATGRARAAGVGNRVHPDGPYEGVRREHGRVRLARAARGHRHAASREAEDRPARQRRQHRDRRRPRLRRGDGRREVQGIRCEDRRRGVDLQAGRRGERHPQHLPGKGWTTVRGDHVDRRRLLRCAADR
jgi:quinoprotein glucose dehydrogenase